MVTHLSEADASAFLRRRGVPVVRIFPAATPEEAARKAEALGWPVVLKLDSPEILHKTEAGGVRLGLTSPDQVLEAGREILRRAAAYRPGARIDGLLVEPQVQGGREVIAGGVRDPGFGPMVMFGLGGIFTEVLKDVAFRMAPLTEQEALAMIRSVKAFPVLAGARGGAPADLAALAALLVAVGQVMVDNPEILELDLNPVAALPEGQGCIALDCLITLDAEGRICT